MLGKLHKKTVNSNFINMSNDDDNDDEKQVRINKITNEFDLIVKEFNGLLLDNEYDELEDDEIVALRTSALKLAYTKKYYDVSKDEIIYFPSISKLIMKGTLVQDAEKQYYYGGEDEEDDEEDEGNEFPTHYSKLLKTAVTTIFPKEVGRNGGDGEEEDNDEYMEKLAMDVEI